MCGIFGIWHAEGAPIAPALADTMCLALQHRGPDHSGRYAEPGLLLGIDRLAILDRAGGNQPIQTADGSLVIVYNGELYNYQELRRELEERGHRFRTYTDTEVALYAFKQYGAACLDRFNGMFALAIWDRPARRLFVARDRLGIKPLYYALGNGSFVFASEAKAVLVALPGRPTPDWPAVHRYFVLGYVAPGESAFAGVRKLPAGHCGYVENGCFHQQPYWTPCYGSAGEVSFNEACERLPGLLRQAVRQELMADVPVGVFLSGGLDSSAVAWCARQEADRPVRSFAIRFPQRTHDESADARLVARHLGLQHEEYVFGDEEVATTLCDAASALDEPFGDPTVLPLLALARRARGHVRVVLTGWGGDELFAGYPTCVAHRWAQVYRRLPRWLGNVAVPALVAHLPSSDKYMSLEFRARRFITGMDLPPEQQHFRWMEYFEGEEARRLFRPEVQAALEPDPLHSMHRMLAGLPETDLLDRILHVDAVSFLEGNGLFQADRMTMAASLEARVPLLNRDVFAFGSALPASTKMRRGRLKELLRRSMRGRLPERILRKPKKGFAPPGAAWLRGPLAGTLRQVLDRARLEAAGVLDALPVQRLIDEHLNRSADHARKLWALLSFQLWYEHWIAGDVGECRARTSRAAAGVARGRAAEQMLPVGT
ncbi:MAG TPA: asparagine synthase (glutamine-hydrolyzing) [Phycisphaerae bacterium]|nr:asparagine synthase (glutamine-hydrolyzing) [Phycisphaerae bacterium]HNU44489.1 asparagine synthase (glutamine-hydrolyzing) [Phycisphaerae bacterium]